MRPSVPDGDGQWQPDAAPEDWAGGGGVDRALADRIDRAAGELADVVTGRPAGARPADPFADPETSFEELLRGTGG